MSSTENSLTQLSLLYSLCSRAFLLINSGNEKQAKEEFPMEYYFIKKYCPADSDELAAVFAKKLELH